MESTPLKIYEAPTMLVVEVKQEGMICASTDGYPQWDPEEI